MSYQSGCLEANRQELESSRVHSLIEYLLYKNYNETKYRNKAIKRTIELCESFQNFTESEIEKLINEH
ncbi:hypothetical protein LCGC14_1088510 [marine sediment metagenome]|uniref:Uncharacterized protein n=1 Tax=marine sediment metagenome TaxID=412755 RepID=A0A0F9MDB7_9ZZZZ